MHDARAVFFHTAALAAAFAGAWASWRHCSAGAGAVITVQREKSSPPAKTDMDRRAVMTGGRHLRTRDPKLA